MKDLAQRNVILDTAFDKFRKFGIRRVTIDEVARDVRISKKTISLHFPNKEAIVRACVERIVTRVFPEVKKALRSREPVMYRILRTWQALSVLPGTVSADFMADLKADYPDIWEDFDKRRHVLFAGFEKLVVDGIASGDIRPEIHPKVALKVFWAIIENVMIPDVWALGEFTPTQAFETVSNMIGRGIFTRPLQIPIIDFRQ